MHGQDCEMIGMRAQVVRVARNTELERELGMSFDMQLECSQFFEQFDNSCLLGANLPGSCLHAEGGNSPPCGQYLLQK
jgi:hypothetical protein